MSRPTAGTVERRTVAHVLRRVAANPVRKPTTRASLLALADELLAEAALTQGLGGLDSRYEYFPEFLRFVAAHCDEFNAGLALELADRIDVARAEAGL